MTNQFGSSLFSHKLLVPFFYEYQSPIGTLSENLHVGELSITRFWKRELQWAERVQNIKLVETTNL